MGTPLEAEASAAHEASRNGPGSGGAAPGPRPPIRAVASAAAVRANEGRRGEGFRPASSGPGKGVAPRRAEVGAQAVRVDGAPANDAASVAPYEPPATTGVKEGSPVMGGRPPRGSKAPLMPGARARAR